MIKRIAAATLMALLLFIHAVKFFHTHNYPLYDHVGSVDKSCNQKDGHVVAETGSFVSSCAICDYHFLKNADLTVSSFFIQRLSSFQVHNAAGLHHTVTSPVFSFLLRGPPSLS